MTYQISFMTKSLVGCQTETGRRVIQRSSPLIGLSAIPIPLVFAFMSGCEETYGTDSLPNDDAVIANARVSQKLAYLRTRSPKLKPRRNSHPGSLQCEQLKNRLANGLLSGELDDLTNLFQKLNTGRNARYGGGKAKQIRPKCSKKASVCGRTTDTLSDLVRLPTNVAGFSDGLTREKRLEPMDFKTEERADSIPRIELSNVQITDILYALVGLSSNVPGFPGGLTTERRLELLETFITNGTYTTPTGIGSYRGRLGANLDDILTIMIDRCQIPEIAKLLKGYRRTAFFISTIDGQTLTLGQFAERALTRIQEGNGEIPPHFMSGAREIVGLNPASRIQVNAGIWAQVMFKERALEGGGSTYENERDEIEPR